MSESSDKLRLGALVALVVGSMVGGGIFSLPQNVAASASAGATLIGWLITGVGMLMLAFVFQTLANRKPKLDGGVYAYAKAGFGDYMGFSSAWGYWISAWIGNVSYMVLLFSTLGYFFPVFGEGNTPVSIICASVLLWLLHFLVLRGIKEAAFINTITTIAQKPLFKKHRPVTVAAWNIVIGAVLLSPFIPSAAMQVPQASSEALLATIYLGLGPSMIAYATYSVMLSKFPASRASNFLYSVPPISTLLGFLWLGEVPTLFAIIGGIMALLGVIIVNLAK